MGSAFDVGRLPSVTTPNCLVLPTCPRWVIGSPMIETPAGQTGLAAGHAGRRTASTSAGKEKVPGTVSIEGCGRKAGLGLRAEAEQGSGADRAKGSFVVGGCRPWRGGSPPAFDRQRGLMDALDFPSFLEATGREFDARIQRAGFYQHPTGTGDAREDIVRQYLQDVLHRRFSIDRGKIFDSAGRLSREFDIIVAEAADVAPAMTLAGRRIVPVEAVCGVIEVKSGLDRDGYDSFIRAGARPGAPGRSRGSGVERHHCI